MFCKQNSYMWAFLKVLISAHNWVIMVWLCTSINSKLPTITSLQMLSIRKQTQSHEHPPLEMSKSLLWALLTKDKFHFPEK